MCFLPRSEKAQAEITTTFRKFIEKEKQIFLGWRDVPIDPTGLGKTVLAEMPVIRQAIVAKGPRSMSQDAFERKILAIRKQTQNPLAVLARRKNLPEIMEFYMPSFSTRTVVYKGLLLANQVGTFYKDLTNPLCTSALASRAPALHHQYVPVLEAGAPVPLHRPQWRDQHGARQRELDVRAPPHDGEPAPRRRPRQECGR